jgi:hypothetical protein
VTAAPAELAPLPADLTAPGPRRPPVEAITAAAAQVKFSKALLNLAGWLLYSPAWIAAKIFGGLWLVLAWCWQAIAMGWADARGKGPARSTLLAENEQLREQLRRLGGG